LASLTPVAVPSRSAGDIEVQLEAYYAEKNGVPLRLTRLELRLLDCLVRSEGRLAPRAALLAAAWDQEDATPNPALLKTHISHLRTKLAEAGGLPVRIESRFGQGYVLSIR